MYFGFGLNDGFRDLLDCSQCAFALSPAHGIGYLGALTAGETVSWVVDHGDPMTLKEIGERVSLSRERVRQIENEALKKLYVILNLSGDERVEVGIDEFNPEEYEAY